VSHNMFAALESAFLHNRFPCLLLLSEAGFIGAQMQEFRLPCLYGEEAPVFNRSAAVALAMN